MMRSALSLRRAATLITFGLLVSLPATLDSSDFGAANASTQQRMIVHHTHGHALHNKCRRTRHDVPRCGVLWGVFRQSVPSTPYWKPKLGEFERTAHRRFDIVKNYSDFRPGSTFPNPAFTRLGNHHRIVYISWNDTNYQTHARVSYSSIANGDWDNSVIKPEARRLKHYHHRIIIDFDHEFDSKAQAGKGTPAEYVAAYRHIHDVMKAAGVHNVIWSWVSTGYLGHKTLIRQSYPGRKYVDWVGYDPYNFAQCLNVPWHRPYRVFHPFYRWSRHQPGIRGKPLILAEYASAPGPHLKHWYGSVAAAIHKMPRIKAAIQFSARSAVPCDVSLDHSKAAMSGWGRSGRSNYVLGH
jgi:hypothetical protein